MHRGRAVFGRGGCGRVGRERVDDLADARIDRTRRERLAEEERIEIEAVEIRAAARRGQQVRMRIAHALDERRRIDRPAVLHEGGHARRIDRLRLDQQIEDERMLALDMVRHLRRHHDEFARLPGAATDADADRRHARGRHVHAVPAHRALGRRTEQAGVEHALRREPHEAFALPCAAVFRGRITRSLHGVCLLHRVWPALRWAASCWLDRSGATLWRGMHLRGDFP
ncbi:hypothetical protein J2W34_005542 [Variovorax boronicumulans]|uniref:hypothetical protein n=1 Tax=Variovorax boronicumulans TaxID=436515 RepID=UPI00277D4B5D|nr:hypothetical protein [Variovorax boronicumulans]MDQ0073722.1 hypothetical protein [Variovorax boronicumulans]